MKQKLRKGLSLTLFLLGLMIFSTAPMNVTGAVIGVPQITSGIVSLIGIALMFAALMVFTAGTLTDTKKDEKLEEKIKKVPVKLKLEDYEKFITGSIYDADFKHLSSDFEDIASKNFKDIYDEDLLNYMIAVNKNEDEGKKYLINRFKEIIKDGELTSDIFFKLKAWEETFEKNNLDDLKDVELCVLNKRFEQLQSNTGDELFRPVIIDACYLINAAKNKTEYKSLMKLIEEHQDLGNKIIIPQDVVNEVKPSKSNHGEKKRLSNLKEALTEGGKGNTLEETDLDYQRKRKKYEAIAEDLLKQTPKYFAWRVLDRLNNGASNIDVYINNLLNAQPNSDEIRSEIDKAVDIYNKANNVGRKELLNRYDVSKGDVSVLANALYLHNNPKISISGNAVNRVKIFSSDEHLLRVRDVFDRRYRKRRGYLEVEGN